jgi:formylglycine-generating enzyme required for sulfatase activity
MATLYPLGTLRVESIKQLPETDMNISVRDADGEWAPVLLVKTELKGLGFTNVSRPTKHAATYDSGRHEYKFYMNANQRVVEITHAAYEPLEVRLLADYGIEARPKRAYELTLAFDEEVVPIPVVITCNQNGAAVYADDDFVGNTENKMLTANIDSGPRRLRIQKDGFATQTQEVTVSLTQNSYDFTLVPAMPAAVFIDSTPQGATVYLDGLKFGTTPVQNFYDAGTYSIQIEKENYDTIEAEITITEPETKKTYLLDDIRATLTIKTHPNATVKFNGENHKGGLNNYKLAPQVLQLRVEMPKAEAIERVVTLKPKSIETLELYPDVQTGTVQVMTIPTNATILLTGDAGERYEAVGRKTFVDVPVGNYELTVTADGHKTHTEMFGLVAKVNLKKQVVLETTNDESKTTVQYNLDKYLHAQDMIRKYSEPAYRAMLKPENRETLQKMQNYVNRFKTDFEKEEMAFVQGGSFQMGSTNGDDDEKPLHWVKVNDFYIGKHEVTQKEWKEVMGSNPSHWKGDNLPVEKVSWYDAVEFCNKKSRAEGLTPCYSGIGENIKCNFSANGYRLPTEAEWEYAARGGNKSKGYKYAGSNSIADVAWYDANSGQKTHTIGTKLANELALFDMTGNVWEWCYDFYIDDYYKKSPFSNPQGARFTKVRSFRGGSWSFSEIGCRIVNRLSYYPDCSLNYIGFRLARSVE